MKKIFFIGGNKTGTTTFHKTLKRLGKFSSRHNTRWPGYSRDHNKEYFLQCDVYSDGGGGSDFEWLDKTFDSFFILNTRNVKDWAVSRWNHHYRGGKIESFKVVVEWIRQRNENHRKIVNYFEDKPNFLSINISTDSPQKIKESLEKASGTALPYLIKKNVAKGHRLYQKEPQPVLKALKKLNIDPLHYNDLVLNLS